MDGRDVAVAERTVTSREPATMTMPTTTTTTTTTAGPAASPGRRSVGDAGIGRAAVRGAALGYVVAFTIVAVIVLVAGGGLGPALGVGAYVAIWGGPGFGGMVAAQRYADRIAAEERTARHEEGAPGA